MQNQKDLSASDSSKNVGGSCFFFVVVVLLGYTAQWTQPQLFLFILIGKHIQSFLSSVPKMAVVSREASLYAVPQQ